MPCGDHCDRVFFGEAQLKKHRNSKAYLHDVKFAKPHVSGKDKQSVAQSSDLEKGSLTQIPSGDDCEFKQHRMSKETSGQRKSVMSVYLAPGNKFKCDKCDEGGFNNIHAMYKHKRFKCIYADQEDINRLVF